MNDNVLSGELSVGEPHPAAYEARAYIASLSGDKLMMWVESFASLALSGNRLAAICHETLDRLLRGNPVSDRYLLGVAFFILLHGKAMTPKKKNKKENNNGQHA